MQKLSSKFDVNVLVVEDYAINQKTIEGLLKMMGCEVDIAESGKDALEFFADNDYDVVLMDVQMSEMDGYQTTAKIRDFDGGKGKKIPIIAVTANAMAGDREKCIESGMDDYLSKPVRGVDLENVLKKYVGNN